MKSDQDTGWGTSAQRCAANCVLRKRRNREGGHLGVLTAAELDVVLRDVVAGGPRANVGQGDPGPLATRLVAYRATAGKRIQ